MKSPLFSGTDWTDSQLMQLWDIMSDLCKKKYPWYWNESAFEILTEEGFIDVSSRIGLPVLYNHWSFGKTYIEHLDAYKKGEQGVAYEQIINSNPAICYLNVSNTLALMVQVLAHASIGHASFFKMNSLFREWTDADSVLPFCSEASKYIRRCEEQYGVYEVEDFISAIHAVESISHDFHLHREPITDKEAAKRAEEKQIADAKYRSYFFDRLFAINGHTSHRKKATDNTVLYESDNFLRMMHDHADLPDWQRNMIAIFMYINRYFYPQMLTKTSNEGWAMFTSKLVIDELYEHNVIGEDIYLPFLHDFSNVVGQPVGAYIGMTERGPQKNLVNVSYVNPYYIGYYVYKEIKRVCDEQDEESLRVCPSLRGANWVEATKEAMMNYSDEDLLYQYMTPKLMRDFKACHFTKGSDVHTGYGSEAYARFECDGDHDDKSFTKMRSLISERYKYIERVPHIRTGVRYNFDKREIPTLELKYHTYKGRRLEPATRKILLKAIKRYFWRNDNIYFSTED